MVIPWSWSCQDLTTVTMFHSMIILWSIMFHSMNIIWKSCFGEKCWTWQPPVNKVYRNRLPGSLFCIFKEALSSWDTAYHTWRDPRRECGLHGSQKNWKKELWNTDFFVRKKTFSGGNWRSKIGQILDQQITRKTLRLGFSKITRKQSKNMHNNPTLKRSVVASPSAFWIAALWGTDIRASSCFSNRSWHCFISFFSSPGKIFCKCFSHS